MASPLATRPGLALYGRSVESDGQSIPYLAGTSHVVTYGIGFRHNLFAMYAAMRIPRWLPNGHVTERGAAGDQSVHRPVGFLAARVSRSWDSSRC
jgi:hypothetical protein